jgi:hypothetical protein
MSPSATSPGTLRGSSCVCPGARCRAAQAAGIASRHFGHFINQPSSLRSQPGAICIKAWPLTLVAARFRWLPISRWLTRSLRQYGPCALLLAFTRAGVAVTTGG